ncbi:MAG: hypothetical protein U0326_25185 [Polyangiales bacterium]
MRTTLSLLALGLAMLAGATSADAQPRPGRPLGRVIRAAAAAPTVTQRALRLRPVTRRVLRAAVAVRPPAPPPSPVTTVLQRMETTLQFTRYSMDNRIDPLMGHYEIDAPGLVTWVLRRATPAAHRAVFAQVRARSPTARDYHDILATASTELVAGDAWLRLTRVSELRAGDVIAWRRPVGPHPSGGHHVCFVAAPPVRNTAGEGWLVRVTDSTSQPHDNDTRGPQSQHRSGLGTGTLLITSDATTDAPTGYGWSGSRTAAITPASVAFGRPLR